MHFDSLAVGKEALARDMEAVSSTKSGDGDVDHTHRHDSEAAVDTPADVQPKVHFSLWSAIGQQYSIMGAPLTIGTYLSLTIGLGGSPAYFWGFVVVAFFNLVLCLAVAELASAIPHSSGQAHWCMVLGHPRYARTISYGMGWLTNAGWYFICGASCLYPAQFAMAIAQAANPDFVAKTWQTYLVYVLFAVGFMVINLPRIFHIQGQLLIAGGVGYNLTAVFLIISLLVRAEHKQTPHHVFVAFINETGWSSDGLVFFLGILPAFICLGVFDNPVHLTDELENPSRQVPLIMLGSFGCSVLAGLVMIIVYQFCNVDPDALLAPVGGQPLVQLFLSAYRSLPLTVIATALVMFCISVGGQAAFISWSRLYWSFSREGALPFSATMSKLSSTDSLPVNALLWGTFLTIALGAISIGSTTAMNALLGGASICILSSLVASIGLALYRGRAKSFNPDRWLNLGGRLGDALFVVALLWSLFVMVMLSMPLYLPVTLSTMNWSSLVFMGIMALSAIYYVAAFSKNKVVHGDGHYPEHHQSQVVQDAINA